MDYPTNLIQLREYLAPGTKLTLTDASFLFGSRHKYAGLTRTVEKQQKRAVMLVGGSWLGLGGTGEKADQFTFDGDTFTYSDEFVSLTYKIEKGAL